ncbi:hypothetical protein RKE30_17335 [Streptomyces sp. Li-HN-5-11]|uniref:hypothetical protein n=1 Tax=Streptomyces sp. Li-HN-5-11 TaxID=3075432 RepID=UPI0028A84684|nr:hypothetical protein [Streptomyces sp. Li-HN-5-11]WNM32048.1 hypothetical protein RKE30_17335 [Streptomyces sp. Li-HN-5-11]
MTVTAQGGNAPRRTTRLQRDNAARHTLRSAREAQRILRDAGDGEELDRKLEELLLDYGDLTGGHRRLLSLALGLEEKQQLINGIARAAVFLRAHNWAECDVRDILSGLPTGEPGDHPGERRVAESLDALGYAMLPTSDAAGWEFALLKEAVADHERWTNIVKGARYLLDPSFLMLFGDTAKILGEATYLGNIKAFASCVQGVERLVGVEELPRQPDVATRLTSGHDVLEVDDLEPLPGDRITHTFRQGPCSMSWEELSRSPDQVDSIDDPENIDDPGDGGLPPIGGSFPF